jgi:hypothetical protein
MSTIKFYSATAMAPRILEGNKMIERFRKVIHPKLISFMLFPAFPEDIRRLVWKFAISISSNTLDRVGKLSRTFRRFSTQKAAVYTSNLVW